MKYGFCDDCNGIRMHYVEDGSGAPVVLLHGFPDFWYSWRKQMPLLVAAGFRCIAPDLRGYNLTDKPRGISSYRIEELVADVVALIENVVGCAVYLIGHDWGGVIAWRVAAERPDLVGRLVIINAPHPDILRRELRHARQLTRLWYAGFFQIPVIPEVVLRSSNYRLISKGAARSPEDHIEYARAFAQPHAIHAALNYYRAALRGMISGRARREPVRITTPTLVLWGERDPALNVKLLDGLDQFVEQLEITRFADVAHWPHVDAADRVNEELLQFLR